MTGAKERKMVNTVLLDKSPQNYKDNSVLDHPLAQFIRKDAKLER